MKTRATSFPVAAVRAAFKSVSLVDEAIVVASVLALVVIASSGFGKVSALFGSPRVLSTYRNKIREVCCPVIIT
jgi:hypothetical protein